ncbi:MAG: tetratricopeptide repeat protein, partial [Phycisphaerales bacterium JB059]
MRTNEDPRRELARVEAVFHDALERAPEEREAFVDLSCADAPDLRDRVMALLRADARESDALDDPQITPIARQLLEDTRLADDLSGQRVGAYRLVRRLGEGGMGSVWLGERDDQEFERRVAVKVIKRGMDSALVLRRFRVERRALGMLEHPSIARLLDAAMTSDGRPALIMEYVEGAPLDQYCMEHALGVRDRLRLFGEVCDAVAHAHRQLVIHRDLKPSNMFVTSEGRPKLIDFGIAKLLSDEETATSVTAPEQRMMTPRYASPEQIRGEAVTTATDIYSLGVVLYELLVGRAPFEPASGSRAELGRLVCEQDPIAPSTAVSREAPADAPGAEQPGDTTRLRRMLEGDLDTIVLRALRKEPDRRYESVAALGEDIRRYLEDRPVLARPDTLTYRARKFVRRHRGAVVAASAGTFVLVLGVATLAGLYLRTLSAEAEESRQRQVAETRLDEANSVASFLEAMLASATPDRAEGRSPDALMEILDAAAERMDQELADQPRVRARIQHTLGASYRQIGAYDKAEDHLREVEATRRELFGSESAELGETLHEYAMVALDRGDLDRAAARAGEALQIFDRIDVGPSKRRANTLDVLGVIAMEQARFEEADDRFREAIAVYERVLPPSDETLFQAYAKRGVLLAQAGRTDEAIGVVEQAIAATERSGVAPSVGNIAMLNSLAVLYRRVEREEEALGLYDRALVVANEIMGREHAMTLVTRSNRSVVLLRLGRLEEAEAEMREVLGVQERILGVQHDQTLSTMFNLARLLEDRDDLHGAEALYGTVTEQQRLLYGDEHPRVGMGMAALGRAIGRLGGADRATEARALLTEATRILEGTLGADHPTSLTRSE